LIDKFFEQMNMFDRNKIGYNFVFMFASPSYMLIKSHGDEHRIDLPTLSHREEYQLITDSLKSAKKEINVHKVHGTQYNLSKVLEE